MVNETGLIHLYCGDGKGKTSCAMGLVLRMLGAGGKVIVAQFLKEGDSSELKALSALPQVQVFSGKPVPGFTFSMTLEQKEQLRRHHTQRLQEMIDLCSREQPDLLVLDEAVASFNLGLLDKELLLSFLRQKPRSLEVALTGREPSPELMELCDYISDIHCLRHPYEKGIQARKGVEL